MPRSSTAPLDRATIARAALELIDENGPGWTMRALGDRLGVRAPSLYSHVSSQEEIVDAVHELINDEIDLETLQAPDLRSALTAFARSYRAAYARHPRAAVLIVRRPIGTESAPRVYDAVLATLLRHGLAPEEALRSVVVLDYLVLGSAVETFIGGFGRTEEYEGRYPALVAALRACDRRTIDQEGFEAGLAHLVEAVAARAAG
ncbi:TetR/AcrR family transcriptional regulator C-terminal domain-containing protein [Kineococcus aurantiacus]|uniref:AcrR family transcriptional regulator n=1 Tax=Kineococcus aurantiacus TaxID=37633 RepID=A0A7Y9AU56_9ACTN|nr:TetR/AcrR family transcriptional regulator C-terminal domain-containing protein [Kineococcus aurantiacus]NYD21796.1 AcrR family transcriptional regulator [Kineococcus aurantiacus]